MAIMEPTGKATAVQEGANRLAFLVLGRAEQNVRAGRFYENVPFVGGALSAALAAVAGGTAFAGHGTIAGVAGVLAAVLTGFLTVHRPEERTASHWRAARDYSRLYDQITLFFTVGVDDVLEEVAQSGPSESPRPTPAL